jgi:hypothetical protein
MSVSLEVMLFVCGMVFVAVAPSTLAELGAIRRALENRKQ